MTQNKVHWKTWIGLALLWIAILSEFVWIWGLLFLAWGVIDLIAGKSFFLEEIRRDKNPVIYWSIVFSWTAFGLYYLSALVVSAN